MMKKRTKVMELAAALGAVLLLLAGLAAVVATPSPGWFPVAAGKDNDQGPAPQALDWLDERYVNEGQPDAVTGAMVSDGSVGIGDVSPEVQAFLSDLETRLTAVEQQLSSTPTPTPTPPTGLVGFWKLDEGSGTTASDSSGSGNNGTLLNGPTWVDGKLNKALSLDGVDDYVDAGSGASLNLGSRGTLEAWVKVLGIDTANIYIVGTGNISTDRDGYTLAAHQTQIFFEIANASANNIVVPSVSLGTNWHHIIGTWDGLNLNLYLDGSNIGTVSQTLTPTFISNLWIGADPQSATKRYFNGVIDEVAVWNRALTPQEVLARFQNP